MEEKSRNEFSLYKTIGDQRPRLLEGGLCPKPCERFVRAREKRSMPETSRAICASEGKAVYARNLASDLCERGKSGLCPKPCERFVRAREKRSMPETSRAICASEGKAFFARNLQERSLRRSIASFFCERYKSSFTSVIKERSMRRSNASVLCERY